MNDLIQRLLEQLRDTSLGTKLVAALSGLSLIAILATAGIVSSEPDYQLVFSGLSNHEVAKVNKALADAGIPFQSSSPPAPFNVFVDEGDRSSAFAAVYGAGALDKPLSGILNESGVASVFNSAEERSQGVRKKEWQEMERMLESLDFVVSAFVRTSPGNKSPLAARAAQPVTASVVLRTQNTLSDRQQDTIAKMVSQGLGIARENLVISDHEGTTLFDGSATLETTLEEEHFDHQVQYDNRMAARANEVLESILGPNKARVTVASEWDYEQKTTRTEASTGKGALVEETKNTAERPISRSGGAVGLSANVAAGDPDLESGSVGLEPKKGTDLETTSQESKTYRPAMTVEEKVNVIPKLERLTVALYLDQSIGAAQVADLATAVQASVGFDPERRDQFSSVVLPFFEPEAPEAAPEEQAVEAGPNPIVETLLRRGVEIVAAVAFLLLLVKTLRGSRSKGDAGQRESSAQAEIDPELLARMSIDELLESDPDKVGELLSSWAREEHTVGSAR